MKTTTIRIPQELDKKLTEYAKEQDLSKNQVVRLALKRLFLQDRMANKQGGRTMIATSTTKKTK